MEFVKPTGNRSLGSPNIDRMDLKEVGIIIRNWLGLALDKHIGELF